MKLKIPEIYKNNHQTYLSAQIQIDNSQLKFPENMWFSIRGAGSEMYSTLADPFLIGAVPIAMRLGEAITVDGPISTRLAHGIEQYQDVLSTWWPSIFKRVAIEYRNLQPRLKDERPGGIGCSFSGGVDSFYTVFQQLAPQERLTEYQLTHALMINGFDQVVDFEGDGSSGRMYEIYQPILEGLGVKLLMLDSNLKHFRDLAFKKPELVLSFGSPLCACAHACNKIFGRFSISGHATYSYQDLKPMGSHPALDHHLSTDQLQMMHIGCGASRTDKIAFLAEYVEIQKSLRVCFGTLEFDDEKDAVVNCCRCEKCVRTLVTLELLGKVEQFSSFQPNYPMSVYMRPDVLASSQNIFLMDNLRLAKKTGRQDWVQALEQAVRYQREVALHKQKQQV